MWCSVAWFFGVRNAFAFLDGRMLWFWVARLYWVVSVSRETSGCPGVVQGGFGLSWCPFIFFVGNGVAGLWVLLGLLADWARANLVGWVRCCGVVGCVVG